MSSRYVAICAVIKPDPAHWRAGVMARSPDNYRRPVWRKQRVTRTKIAPPPHSVWRRNNHIKWMSFPHPVTGGRRFPDGAAFAFGLLDALAEFDQIFALPLVRPVPALEIAPAPLEAFQNELEGIVTA